MMCGSDRLMLMTIGGGGGGGGGGGEDRQWGWLWYLRENIWKKNVKVNNNNYF